MLDQIKGWSIKTVVALLFDFGVKFVSDNLCMLILSFIWVQIVSVCVIDKTVRNIRDNTNWANELKPGKQTN